MPCEDSSREHPVRVALRPLYPVISTGALHFFIPELPWVRVNRIHLGARPGPGGGAAAPGRLLRICEGEGQARHRRRLAAARHPPAGNTLRFTLGVGVQLKCCELGGKSPCSVYTHRCLHDGGGAGLQGSALDNVSTTARNLRRYAACSSTLLCWRLRWSPAAFFRIHMRL